MEENNSLLLKWTTTTTVFENDYELFLKVCFDICREERNNNNNRDSRKWKMDAGTNDPLAGR